MSGATRSTGGSAAKSRAFYRALGPTGLAIRTKPEWDAQILDALLGQLPRGGRLLDVGCGYGRTALPLAERGFDVTGFDISRALLRAARRDATRRGLSIRFDEGSMTALPYESRAFDAVVCLWSAFYELLEETEQVAALGEMRRVLLDGGVGVIEGPAYEPPTEAEIASGTRHGPEHRLVAEIVAGQRLEYVAHDARSLARVATAAGIHPFRTEVTTWAGRERQLLVFERAVDSQ